MTVSPLGGGGLQGHFKAPQQWPTVCVTRSLGENILGLEKGDDNLYTAFGERISQNYTQVTDSK